MTPDEMAEALKWWLDLQRITIMPEAFGRQMDNAHFRLGIIQIEPEPRKRVFEVAPLDVADCYEVREIAA